MDITNVYWIIIIIFLLIGFIVFYLIQKQSKKDPRATEYYRDIFLNFGIAIISGSLIALFTSTKNGLYSIILTIIGFIYFFIGVFYRAKIEKLKDEIRLGELKRKK